MKKAKLILPIALLSASVLCGAVSYSYREPVRVYAEAETSEVVEAEVAETEATEEFNWKTWLEGWVSPQTITTLVSVFGALGAVLKMASSIKQLHNQKQLTIKNVTEAIQKELPDDVKEIITPYMDKILKSEEQIVRIMEVFSKVLALSQEDTPEAKIAILNAIQELGMVQKEVTEQAKQIIQEKVEAEQKKEEEKKAVVAEVAEQTASYDGTSI